MEMQDRGLGAWPRVEVFGGDWEGRQNSMQAAGPLIALPEFFFGLSPPASSGPCVTNRCQTPDNRRLTDCRSELRDEQASINAISTSIYSILSSEFSDRFV